MKGVEKMDWLGIGVVIIGIALFVLVVILIKPLNKLAGIFNNLQKTTSGLPQQMEELTSQATEALRSGNDTLHEVNQQVKELTPIFQLVGDATRAANYASSSLVDAVMKVKKDTDGNEFTKRNHLEGIYGLATLAYYIIQQSKRRNTIDMES